MQKGRNERDKLRILQTRGTPDTFIDESLMHPLHFKTNNNFKGTFDNYRESKSPYASSNINQKLANQKATEFMQSQKLF